MISWIIGRHIDIDAFVDLGSVFDVIKKDATTKRKAAPHRRVGDTGIFCERRTRAHWINARW